MHSRFRLDGIDHALWLSRQEDGYRLHLADAPHGVAVALSDPGQTARTPGTVARRDLIIDGGRESVAVALDGDHVHIHLAGRNYVLAYLDPVSSLAGDAAGAAENEARAPMPGTVVAVHVRPGDVVEIGDALLVIESMKLETTIRAPRAGTVATVPVTEGQGFDRDQVLATLAEAA